MVVLINDRMLATRARTFAEDSHGDKVATGFGPASDAYPGLAQIGPDTPLGQPGDRPWVLDLDPALDPVSQQDLVVDVNSGEQWNVTSAQLITNAWFSQLNHIRVEARLYVTGGSES